MSKGSRAWCFTLNNYSAEEETAVQGLDCVYVVYGREVGEQGTPHLQGYVHFKNAKTLSAVKKLMPRAHLEVRQGTIDQAIDYCKKDGDVFERGTPPATQAQKGELGKAAMKEIIKRAREGDEEWLEENHPAEYYRHLATFRSHRKKVKEVLTHSDEDTPHEWWYGATGTGKSRKLWAEYPDHFPKKINKWWCGYTGQEVVAIEEWAPGNDVTTQSLKTWADRYPFPAEIKHGHMGAIRPKKIIVLSNYTLEECFPNPNDLEPMKRRFKVVEFGGRPSAFHPSFNVFQ